MITRVYNPIERGRPAVWIEGGIERGMTARIARRVCEYEADGAIEIVVDSTGGSCAEGFRLFNMLREVPREKRITVLRAGSMAAIVTAAGDRIRIVRDGHIFLHPPGYRRDVVADMVAEHMTASDMRAAADRLDETDELHLDILTRRGADRETIRKLSNTNTRIDAKHALAVGLVDEVIRRAR